MSEKISFDLRLYETGNYDVITRDGHKAIIYLIDRQSAEYPILGDILCEDSEKCLTEPLSWNKNGCFSNDKPNHIYDLLLVEKEINP